MVTTNYTLTSAKIRLKRAGCATLCVALVAAGIGLLPTLTSWADTDTPEVTYEINEIGRICSANPTGSGGANFTSIQAAINDATCDTINIVAGNFVESLTITRNVVLIGAGVTSTLINGNGITRTLNVNAGVVSARGIAFVNGKSTGISGGGIRSLAGSSLKFERVLVANNNAFGGIGVNGGGISAGGRLELIDSQVSDNFSGWYGGGIYAQNGLTVTRSLIARNFNNKDGTPGNGGGIYLQAGPARIVNSTIAYNNARIGSALFVEPTFQKIELIHTSLFSNTLGAVGAGIPISTATAIVSNSSITVTNTVIVNPIAGNTTNCGAPLINGGGNFGTDASCGIGPGVDVRLDPFGLKDNGGPTYSFSLATNSPAIDSATDAGCALASVSNIDQRGLPRPKDGNGDGVSKCDAGAFETQAAIIVPPSTTCAAPNLLQNGDFSNNLTGWTEFVPGRFKATNQTAVLSGTGTLNQAFSATVGTLYSVTLDLRINRVISVATSPNAGIHAIASNAGFGALGATEKITRVTSGSGFIKLTTVFIATSATSNLSLIANDGGAYEAVFDNVLIYRCVQGPTPTPGPIVPTATPFVIPPTATPSLATPTIQITPPTQNKLFLPVIAKPAP